MDGMDEGRIEATPTEGARDRSSRAVLFDWGDTVMRVFPEYDGPMHGWPTVEAIPGIDSILRSLHHSFILGLATNAEDSMAEDIRRALERCGLEGHFDHIFCFREVGHRKPEAAFFNSVLERLRLSPHQVFMVGDNLEADVLAANQAGLSAVWFNPRSDRKVNGSAHRTIHRFEELPMALAQLGATPQ